MKTNKSIIILLLTFALEISGILAQPNSTGTVKDIEGNTYKTVTIGTQV